MAGSLLSCTACLRRTIQVVARSGATAEASWLHIAARPGQHNGRPYTTPEAAGLGAVDAPPSSPAETPDAKEMEKMEWAVTKQLSYLGDPWNIAQHVERTLAKGRFDEALLLTQKASYKDRQVVVAWNHLIEYVMRQQQLRKAIKLFNQMKKRAQLPNAQTFTILFRGCADSQHPKLAVAEAVKHYNVLLKDQRLQPNSIHLNAVLNVCARAGDMDSLFLIADTVDDTTRPPTAYTYTIIFNALRHHALLEMKGLSPEQCAVNHQSVVDRAKGLWSEVMEKWKRGRVVVDEALVCSMGRVLLLAPMREDKREVLDLLHQIMAIPNLAKTPDSDGQNDPDMKDIAISGSAKRVAGTGISYAVPGRNTLALMLTALTNSRQTTAGIRYWNLMVGHYGIVPDRDNWIRMFAMLKTAKASSQAAVILDLMPSEYLDPKPYCIAMETCVRDNINPNAVKNAAKALDSMMARLPLPDLMTLRLFLRVALVSHFQFRAKARNGEETAAKREYGEQIIEALTRLWGPYTKAYDHYFEVSRPVDKKEEAVLYNSKREVIALARLMHGASNKVMNEGMLPHQELAELRSFATRVSCQIQEFYMNRNESEPNLNTPKDQTAQGEPDEVDSDAGASSPGASSPGASSPGVSSPGASNPGTRVGADFVWDTTKPLKPSVSRRQRLEAQPWRKTTMHRNV